jgi:hypothetical protein
MFQSICYRAFQIVLYFYYSNRVLTEDGSMHFVPAISQFWLANTCVFELVPLFYLPCVIDLVKVKLSKV